MGGMIGASVRFSVRTLRSPSGREGRSSQRSLRNFAASSSVACSASFSQLMAFPERSRKVFPFNASISRTSMAVRRRGWMSPAIWKRARFLPSICNGRMLALAIFAKRTIWGVQWLSRTTRSSGRREATWPAGKMSRHPPVWRCANAFRIPDRFVSAEVPNGLT